MSLTGRLGVDESLLSEVCRRYGVGLLLVFGSVARGSESATSDIDVLYELEPGRRLGWEIDDLADELAEVLGRPVDLVAISALHRRLRDTVLAEAQPLYAAEVLLPARRPSPASSAQTPSAAETTSRASSCTCVRWSFPRNDSA